MGSEYVARCYPKCTVDALSKLVRADIDQAGYEDGHLYSGEWGEKCGVTVLDKTFECNDTAEDYLVNRTSKYDPKLSAVKVISNKHAIKNSDQSKWHWYVASWCRS